MNEQSRVDAGGPEITRLGKPLIYAAMALEAAAIIGALGGVVGGIALALHRQADTYGDTTHPWVAVGISVVAASILAGTFNWTVARAVRVFAVDAAARHGVDG